MIYGFENCDFDFNDDSLEIRFPDGSKYHQILTEHDLELINRPDFGRVKFINMCITKHQNNMDRRRENHE